MRILLTVPSLAREFGGPAIVRRSLARELVRQGETARIVGCGPADGPEVVSLGAFVSFHATPIPTELGPVRRLVRSADIVHIIGYRDPVGTAAAITARTHGKPYLVEPVGMHRPRLRSIPLKVAFDATVGKWQMVGAAGIIATSQLERSELVADGVPVGQIILRPNGIPSGLFPLPPRGRLRRRLGIPIEAPLVLSLGRIAAKKGLHDLVSATGSLDGAWVLIAGPDDGDGTLETIRRLRDRLPHRGRVMILPEGLWGEDKRRALADADVFCLPSATENFAIAPAEAAAAGMPVVVSDRCGVAEWLEPAASVIVPFGRRDVLASALRAVLTNVSYKEAATATADLMRTRFDWSRIVGEQRKIYNEVVARFEGTR